MTGPFEVSSYSKDLPDSPAYAGATVYYPTNADPLFAGVAVAPGFTETQSAINGWGASSRLTASSCSLWIPIRLLKSPQRALRL
jgi:hypothetical protein